MSGRTDRLVGLARRMPYIARPTNISSCRSCKAVVVWCLTTNGKKTPLEPCGAPHFACCPNAAQHRKRKG